MSKDTANYSSYESERDAQAAKKYAAAYPIHKVWLVSLLILAVVVAIVVPATAIIMTKLHIDEHVTITEINKGWKPQ